jgi:hypothetical protein
MGSGGFRVAADALIDRREARASPVRCHVRCSIRESSMPVNECPDRCLAPYRLILSPD